MKFIETLKNVWKITELKDRILLTLGLLLVYRFGAQVVLPGIDASQLGSLASKTDTGLLGLLNAFTGGAFAKASVFALGIMPYISASIVVQLMGIAIPYLQKLQKEGASGQKKITQITRWLTIGICLVQAPAYLTSLPALMGGTQAFTLGQGGVFYFSSISNSGNRLCFCNVVRRKDYRQRYWKWNLTTYYGRYYCKHAIVICTRI